MMVSTNEAKNHEGMSLMEDELSEAMEEAAKKAKAAAAQPQPLHETRSLTEQFDIRNRIDGQLRTNISRKRTILNYEYDVQKSDLQLQYEKEQRALSDKYQKKVKELVDIYELQIKELDNMLRTLGDN